MCSDHAKSLESKIPRSLTKFVAGMMFPLKIVGDHIGRHGTEVTARCRLEVKHNNTSIMMVMTTGGFSKTISLLVQVDRY